MRILRKLLKKYLMNRGFSAYMAPRFARMFFSEFKMGKVPLKEKLWAMKRGFLPSRIEVYGLNNDNYRQFLSDYEYLRLHPINNDFEIWINDKITLKYVLQDSRFVDFMPRYFIYIERDGHYTYLMDFDERINKDSDALLNVLKTEKTLAVKPLDGSGGYGFMKLEYRDNEIFANGKKISTHDFEVMKSRLKGYIVTEYCLQHSSLTKVWPKSECTLRIIIAKIHDQYGAGESHAIVSYARFGTSISGSTSNLSQGGVGVPFEYESGAFGDFFYRYKKFDPNGQIKYEFHPDTHVSLRGIAIPNWEIVKKGIDDMVTYMSTLEYFGFDVIITENGFKICEINSLPQIDYEQVMCGPIWTKQFAKRFFERKIAQKP